MHASLVSTIVSRIVQLSHDGLVSPQIARETGVSTASVSKYLRSAGIRGRRTYAYLKALSRRQEAVLLGTLLGDAYLRRRGTTHARLWLKHAERQESYLKWKVAELRPLFRAGVYRARTKEGHLYVRTVSRTHPILTAIHSLFYSGPKGRKSITAAVLARLDALGDQLPLALAVWYMDDGCRAHERVGRADRADIALGLLTPRQRRLVVSWFADHGYEGSCSSDRCARLRMTSTTSRTFFAVVGPHVHPCLRYKLPR